MYQIISCAYTEHTGQITTRTTSRRTLEEAQDFLEDLKTASLAVNIKNTCVLFGLLDCQAVQETPHWTEVHQLGPTADLDESLVKELLGMAWKNGLCSKKSLKA